MDEFKTITPPTRSRALSLSHPHSPASTPTCAPTSTSTRAQTRSLSQTQATAPAPRLGAREVRKSGEVNPETEIQGQTPTGRRVPRLKPTTTETKTGVSFLPSIVQTVLGQSPTKPFEATRDHPPVAHTEVTDNESHSLVFSTTDPLFMLVRVIAGEMGRDEEALYQQGWADVVVQTMAHERDRHLSQEIDDVSEMPQTVRVELIHLHATIDTGIRNAIARMRSVLTSSLKNVRGVDDILNGGETTVINYFGQLVANLVIYAENKRGLRAVLQQNAYLINDALRGLIDALNDYEFSTLDGRIFHSITGSVLTPDTRALFYNFLA